MTRFAISILLALQLLAVGAPASADCRWVTTTETRFTLTGIVTDTRTVQVCDGPEGSSVGSVLPSSLPAAEACPEQAASLELVADVFCHDAQQAMAPDEPAVVTTAMVANALARVELPPSELTVQPPNGRTLVNFDTNFYTVSAVHRRSINLLGQTVQLEITPSSYSWHFERTAHRRTGTPGAPYPDLQVTHRYRARGDYAPSVDTTYTAIWRLGDGEWRAVPGSVTIEGASVPLRAVEARPTLVASR